MSLWLGLQVGLHCSWEGWCIDPCREGWRFVEGSVLRHMWKPISLLACDDCKWWEPWPLKISQGGGDFSWCITSTHSWRVVIRVYSLAVQVFGLHYFQFEDANSANTSFRRLDNGCQVCHLLHRERVSAECDSRMTFWPLCSTRECLIFELQLRYKPVITVMPYRQSWPFRTTKVTGQGLISKLHIIQSLLPCILSASQ